MRLDGAENAHLQYIVTELECYYILGPPEFSQVDHPMLDISDEVVRVIPIQLLLNILLEIPKEMNSVLQSGIVLDFFRHELFSSVSNRL